MNPQMIPQRGAMPLGMSMGGPPRPGMMPRPGVRPLGGGGGMGGGHGGGMMPRPMFQHGQQQLAPGMYGLGPGQAGPQYGSGHARNDLLAARNRHGDGTGTVGDCNLIRRIS